MAAVIGIPLVRAEHRGSETRPQERLRLWVIDYAYQVRGHGPNSQMARGSRLILSFETAKAVARLVVSSAVSDPVGIVEGIAALSRIYLASVEASVRRQLLHVIRVEFSNISDEDIQAVDASVRLLIARSDINPVDAVARPRVVLDQLLAEDGATERAALGSADLAALFDRFLMTAIVEFGQAAKLLPSISLDSSITALQDVAAVSARMDRLEQGLSEEVDRVKEKVGRGAPDIPVDLVVQAYRTSLDEYLPAVVDLRSREISDTRSFLGGVGSQWWGWRGEAWCGKSTLMAMILADVESDHEVVPFFINGRQIGSRRREDFIARTLPRLAQLCGEDFVPQTSDGLEVDFYRAYLFRAAESCASRGQTLVYLIDGLDEDAGDAGSILAVLPSTLPGNTRAVVAARPVPLPRDISPNHDLQHERVWHRLEQSELARVARSTAEDDVNELLASATGRSVAELLAAAGAPLTAADLAELTDTSVGQLRVELLSRREGRCLTTAAVPPIDPRDSGPNELGYRLAHEEVMREIVISLRPQAARVEGASAWQAAVDQALAQGRQRLTAWADDWQDRAWPLDTPRYLIREYAELLAANREYERLSDLERSPGRQELLEKAWGVPWRAQEELLRTVRVLARDTSDLAATASLRMMLDIRAPNGGSLDPKIPEAWARLGRQEYADYLCDQTIDLQREEALARLLRLAIHMGQTARATHLAQLLGLESPTVVKVLAAASMELDRDALLAQVRHSDELSSDEDWDIRKEFADVSQLIEHEVARVSKYETEWENSSSGWSALEGIRDERALSVQLLRAAESGDAELVAQLAERLDWDCARMGAPGRLTQDGQAFARAIVRLGAAQPIVSVLRARLTDLDNADATTDEGVARYMRAEDALMMLVNLAKSLRQAGHRTEADEVANAVPDSYWAETYWSQAAIDAAGGNDPSSSITYATRIKTPRLLAETLASLALVLAWVGAPQALGVAKAAELAGHVLDVDSYAAWKLQLLAGAVNDPLHRELETGLLETCGKLLSGVENPDVRHRQLHRLADLLAERWAHIDGDSVLAVIGIEYVTELVHTRLAVEAMEAGSFNEVMHHLHFLANEDAQATAARVLVHYGSPATMQLLEGVETNGPSWLALALTCAREELVAEAAQEETARRQMLAARPSPGESAAKARAQEAVLRVGDAVGARASQLAEAARVVLNEMMGLDEYAWMRGIVEQARDIPSVQALVAGLVASEDEHAVRALVSDLCLKCFELGDRQAALQIVEDLEDELDRDAGLQALFACYLAVGEESKAEQLVSAMSWGYDRSCHYRDLAVHALRDGRPERAGAYAGKIEADYSWLVRDLREAEVGDAMSRLEIDLARQLVAADIAQYEIDDMTIRMLEAVAPEALITVSQLAVGESRDLLRRLSSVSPVLRPSVEPHHG